MTIMIFLFTQKAAYDMRISDWSSDVCSSDLFAPVGQIEGFAPGITIGPLGNAHIGQIVDPQFGEHRRYRRYLPLAAVDQHQIGPFAPGPLGVLFDRAGEAAQIGRASWRGRVCQSV